MTPSLTSHFLCSVHYDNYNSPSSLYLRMKHANALWSIWGKDSCRLSLLLVLLVFPRLLYRCCCRLLTLLFTSILTVSSLCVTVVLSPLIYGTGTLNYDIHKLATNHLGWQFLNDNELHDNHWVTAYFYCNEILFFL